MTFARPTWKENFSAILVLLVLIGGVALFVWYAKTSGKLVLTPKHVCPYCGQEIKVNLEKNGEKKP